MATKISMSADGSLQVPTDPIIPFIEGDGTGVDIWPAAKLVLDAAAKKHGNTVEWKEVLAGEKAFNETGNWLPDETIDVFASTSSASRARSPRRSAAASVRSTSRCARSSTCTCACGPCAGSPACRRP